MTELSRRGFLTLAPKAVAGIVLASSFPEIAIWDPDIVEAKTPYPLLDMRMVTLTILDGIAEVWKPETLVPFDRIALYVGVEPEPWLIGETALVPSSTADTTAGCDIVWTPGVPVSREYLLQKGRVMGVYMRRHNATVSMEMPVPQHVDRGVSVRNDARKIGVASGLYYNVSTDQMVMTFRCLGGRRV